VLHAFEALVPELGFDDGKKTSSSAASSRTPGSRALPRHRSPALEQAPRRHGARPLPSRLRRKLDHHPPSPTSSDAWTPPTAATAATWSSSSNSNPPVSRSPRRKVHPLRLCVSASNPNPPNPIRKPQSSQPPTPENWLRSCKIVRTIERPPPRGRIVHANSAVSCV